MKREKAEPTFEEKLEALEALTARMEDGKLGLEELLKLYEQGSQLAGSLKKDLDKAKASLVEIKDGAASPADES